MKVHNWPTVDESYQWYLRDNQGVIWLADTQFGAGVATAVTPHGSITVGLSVLRDLRGPLHLLKGLGSDILDQLETIAPRKNLNQAIQEIKAVTEEEARRLGS